MSRQNPWIPKGSPNAGPLLRWPTQLVTDLRSETLRAYRPVSS